MIRRRSSRSSPARHRAAASPAPCGESRAHPSLAPACPPALQSVGELKTWKGREWTDRWTDETGRGKMGTTPRPPTLGPLTVCGERVGKEE